VTTVGGVLAGLADNRAGPHQDLAKDGWYLVPLIFAIAGAVVLVLILADWAWTGWCNWRRRRQLLRRHVQLEGAGDAMIGGRPNTLLWLAIRATNHGNPTVLTHWGITLTLGNSQISGSHAYRPPLPTGEEVTMSLFQLDALDEETATAPFQGERIGRMAFWLPVPSDRITTAAAAGTRLDAHVHAQDGSGRLCEGEIDLLKLFSLGRRDFGTPPPSDQNLHEQVVKSPRLSRPESAAPL
jgi:hypothetical protein